MSCCFCLETSSDLNQTFCGHIFCDACHNQCSRGSTFSCPICPDFLLRPKEFNYTFLAGEQIDPELICGLCQDPFTSPLRLDSCGHAFCKRCINDWSQIRKACPCCCKKWKSLFSDSNIIQEMNKLQISCNICQSWEGLLSDFEEHLEQSHTLGTICSFCLDTTSEPIGADCDHVFCTNCANELEQRGEGCPICPGVEDPRKFHQAEMKYTYLDPQPDRREIPAGLICTICQDGVSEAVKLDKCTHIFCQHCINDWSQIVKTCPACCQPFDHEVPVPDADSRTDSFVVSCNMCDTWQGWDPAYI
eukprot:TRINITY_DN3557_c0_g1_i2.p1 TRINITY_DN3557_c0_g1~~TRINITY_DN3557_c0_g1_i2.p1  ORF type:complete len:304 (-),score=27.43 TRINITY_DN3557_c0_g1_i2:75-986(-)